jgi:hypothetical protein
VLGVKTVGHATLIAYDDAPLLATDPWLGGGGAFFGSWQLSHAIPAAELADIRACPYVWISHGHPDHLSIESLTSIPEACILLPDHRGGRIHAELTARGRRVRVLGDRVWTALSRRVRVCAIADVMQNAILLVEINGRLFLNLNDASDRGWGRDVRAAVTRFPHSYLLKLAPTGNLGVLNLFDETGQRRSVAHVDPRRAGAELASWADSYGVRYVVPFSSLHQYQRTDSAWANALNVPLDVYAASFASKTGATLLPAFLAIDCGRDDLRALAPPALEPALQPPEVFGDCWSDELERDDVLLVERYFRRKAGLRERVGFVAVRVGGVTQRIVLNDMLATGVTLDAPRTSLMAAVRGEMLDDLLLGHFAKITLHGLASLAPSFIPDVTRFADWGRAEQADELAAYHEDYHRRAIEPLVWHVLGDDSAGRVRPVTP